MIGFVFAAVGLAVNAVIWLAFRPRRPRDPHNINSEYEQ